MIPSATPFVPLLVLGVIATTAGAQATKLATAPASTRPVVTVEALADLPRGITLDELQGIMATPPRHQFTARIDGGERLAVSYAFGETWARLYFVFRNGKLEKIVEPPPSEYKQVPYKGGILELKRPVDAEKRLEVVLAAPDLAGAQPAAAIRGKLPKRSRPPINVLPPFEPVPPVPAAARPRIVKNYQRNLELARRFDPFKLKLGMTPAAVDREFGEPLRLEGDGGPQPSRVYDSDEEVSVNPEYAFSPVAVVFEKDAATRIFSNDFVDQKVNKRAWDARRHEDPGHTE